MRQALWTALAIGLLPIAIIMARKINSDMQAAAIDGSNMRSRWCLTSEVIRRDEDPFGYWVAISFNICVLVLLSLTIIASLGAAITGD
jgi:hypothetical protein